MAGRRIRIVSDGTPQDTHVYDVESGEELEDVESVSWECGVGQVARATVSFILVELEGLGDLKRAALGPAPVCVSCGLGRAEICDSCSRAADSAESAT